jgi:hypothetical protein
MFARAANGFLQLREYDTWSVCMTGMGILSLEHGSATNAFESAKRALTKAEELGHGPAINQQLSCVIQFSKFMTEDDMSFALETKERLVESLKIESGLYILGPSLRWQVGQCNADEMVRAMIADKSKWSNTWIYYQTISFKVISYLEAVDWAVAAGKDTLGGLQLSELMSKVVEKDIRFAEGLAKVNILVRPWAFVLRGAMLRRKGNFSRALR